ncbi:MAG: DUF2400 domain-containing protein [Deltaproteobacteria bacterium]|nr:DUF2400 domain-containing protein [Deltaproteobacteria bacterium]
MNLFAKRLKRFKHRFADRSELAALLFGIENVIAGFGSIYACFLAGFSQGDEFIPFYPPASISVM